MLHSHSINAVMATLLQQHKGKGCAGEFRVTNLEMIKVRSRSPWQLRNQQSQHISHPLGPHPWTACLLTTLSWLGSG